MEKFSFKLPLILVVLLVGGCFAFGWSKPVLYENGITSSVTAISDNGNIAIASWSYNDSTQSYEIGVTHKRNGVWRTPFVASHGTNVYDPKIVMNRKGDILLTWHCWGTSGEVDSIKVKEYRNGVWLPNWKIPTSTQANDIGINDSGYALIAWTDNTGVHIEERINDQWIKSDLVSSIIATGPAVTVSKNGTAVVAWRYKDYLGLNQAAAFASVRESGQWGQPELVSNAMNSSDNLYLRSDDAGNATMAWESANSGNFAVYTNEYRDGAWTGMQSHTDFANSYHFPSLSMSANGNALLSWREYDPNSGYHIFKQQYQNGIWEPPTEVAPGYISYAKISKNGDSILIWENIANNQNQLMRSQRLNGKWQSPEIVAGSDDLVNDLRPDLGMNNFGDISLVWTQSVQGVWNSMRSNYTAKR